MFCCIDLYCIFVIGFGLIFIGQVVEFDYVGIQVCLVFKEEGYEVIFVNFNFVMIMIDCDVVDKVYIELIIFEFVFLILCWECFDVIVFIFGG